MSESIKTIINAVQREVDTYDGYSVDFSNSTSFEVYGRKTDFGSFLSGTLLFNLSNIDGVGFVGCSLENGFLIATFCYG